jgi:hypothetical protein
MARVRDFVMGTFDESPDVGYELLEHKMQLPVSVDSDVPVWVVFDRGALDNGNYDVIEELAAETTEEAVKARVAHWQAVHDAQDPSVYAKPEPSYVKKRTSNYAAYQPSYASITEQLDMMYRDAVNGTTEWQEHIAAVKAAHPKPE